MPASRRARLGILILVVPLLIGLAGPFAGDARAADGPKVVIVVGPVGSETAHYKRDANQIAAEASRYTRNVIKVYTPNATWARVKASARGANIFVYLGHGNGWPSPYAPFQTVTKDGLGLDPAGGGNGTTTVYYGEGQVASEIRLAPHAAVLLYHLCYASGNSEPGLREGSFLTARARVDNFGAGFLAAGASVVFAEGHPAHPVVNYMRQLFTTNRSMAAIFRSSPASNGHVMGSYPSLRSPGRTFLMDPDKSRPSGFYRSVIGTLSMKAAVVRARVPARGGGTGGNNGGRPGTVGGTRTTKVWAALNRTAFFPQDRDILRATTTFTYGLSAPATVRIVVLNMGGHTVRVLYAGRASKGTHTVKWDGRSKSGRLVPQSRYRVVIVLGSGASRTVVSRDVRVQAFRLTTSFSTAIRGHPLTITAVSTEPLGSAPTVVVRQPGLSPWVVTMHHVTGRIYRATLTPRRTGGAGGMRLSVTARDVNGGSNVTARVMPLR